MQDIRPKGAHYGIYVQYAEGAEPCVDLQTLARYLPHGSGIDGDYYIHVYKNGNIKVTGDYHPMNGHGYYLAWQKFSFRIYRATIDVRNPLRGPCAGKVQILERKGCIYSAPVKGARDANEMLTEWIDYALAESRLLEPWTSVTVEDA